MLSYDKCVVSPGLHLTKQLFFSLLRVCGADIKPSNMLVNLQGQVKLCDFGVSVQVCCDTSTVAGKLLRLLSSECLFALGA